MADQANDQYAVLERLYSERHWAEVEAGAESLLGKLNSDGDEDGDGNLRARVLLLLGHTRLYGFNDVAVAAEHYRGVLATEPEALLHGIAQEGLNQCLAAEGPCPADAMPWLQKIAGPEIAASGAGPAPTSNSAQEAAKETFQSFPGFIQPLETVENLTNSDSPLREASASPAGPSPAEITDEPGTPNQLSPKESAELAKGLLSVVIRPN